MRISVKVFFTIIAAIGLFTSAITLAGGPETVGTVNVSGELFMQDETDFADPIYFLEINYDGVAPMKIHTRLTTDPIDTELGLYDSMGNLIGTNDDFDFPASLLSEIQFGRLEAGQYFLAVGLFNTVFNPGFDVTSTSTASGNAVVTIETGIAPVLEGIVNVDLNYNFNGIVHSDEPSDPVNNPDDPNGFRSISDRALDFRNGVPTDETLDRYSFVAAGGELDIVHLGNRNTVSMGAWFFDTEPDLDGIGIQPDWLDDPDQSGRQTTVLTSSVPMHPNSQVTVLFQYSNGGGSFDIVVGFTDGSEHVITATGPDWFGPFNGQPNIGIFDGAFGTDFGFMDPLGNNTLLITEAIIDLGSFAGSDADELSFENASNINGGVAVLAANFAGSKADCLVGDLNGDGMVTLLDVGPFVDAIVAGIFLCEADANQDGVVDLLDVGPFIDLLTN